MNSSKLKENICRICLQYKVDLSWDDEILETDGVSYKDCYYKYTKLLEKDPDFYPTNLCEKCAEELRSAHMLFEKALESFKVLEDLGSKYFDMDMFNDSTPAIKSEVQSSEVVNMDDDMLLRTEEKPSLLTLHAIEKSPVSEKGTSELNEIEESDVASVESTHFMDIHDFESSVEIPFEEHFGELCDSEGSTSSISKRIRRNRVQKVLPPSLMHQKETSDTTKTRKRKISKALSEEKLCKNNNTEIKETGIEDRTLIGNKTKSQKRKRIRRKYPLMCSYCSLIVDGGEKLARHEATHDENRERKAVCPDCGVKFYNNFCLSLHRRIHDVNRQKIHKCDFCEKAFFNKGTLTVHRRIHIGLSVKCQICEKDFPRQIDLDKHLVIHSASPLENVAKRKKYVVQCQYCSKSISTDKLKEHLAVHTNQPQMKCTICDKDFYIRTKCTNHLRRFHLKNKSEYDEFIHYYVDRNTRLSSLMVKQKLNAKTLKE